MDYNPPKIKEQYGTVGSRGGLYLWPITCNWDGRRERRRHAVEISWLIPFRIEKNANIFFGCEVLVRPGWWPCRSGRNGNGKVLNRQKNGWKTAFPGKFMEVAEELTSPLKIDGWKIEFPYFRNRPFSVDIRKFSGYMQNTKHSLNTLVSPKYLVTHINGENPRKSLRENPDLKIFRSRCP